MNNLPFLKNLSFLTRFFDKDPLNADGRLPLRVLEGDPPSRPQPQGPLGGPPMDWIP